jgi:hypothetical protein
MGYGVEDIEAPSDGAKALYRLALSVQRVKDIGGLG